MVQPAQNSTVFHKAEALLDKLTSPADLAELLVAKGIRGVQADMCACPVSRWLRQELEVRHVTVDYDDIRIHDEIGNEYEFRTPYVIRHFMEVFDNEPIAELIDVNGATDEELWDN